MTPDVLRIQVEDLRGNSRAVTVPTGNIPEHARRIVNTWLDDTAAALDRHPETIALLAIAHLVERHHDRDAYHRECTRRGLLPL